ncbi:hypothetical protein [Nocardiopsis lambiniae]|uniref:Secreted protein n=1 Tax=Nocardiopsis lambiniae TaxID=3075539 RepID=A0ABU2M4K8_9ACTN|nr:hypothetical protein [Nocardiopsis sp. DSM 44743]MDT0327537.1 hypothetical protein [Nocardiopsis sp. DSM 44743]
MSHARDQRRRGSLGTGLLAGACCAGAVAYGVIVGPSMLPPQQDVQAATALSPDLAGLEVEAEGDGTSAPRGPIGVLEIQVSDRDRAWVQTLVCEGDAELDPPACADLAAIAAEFQGEPGGSAEHPSAGEDREGEAEEEGSDEQTPEEIAGITVEPTTAALPGSEALFTEVSQGTVCTDKVYGPQEAVIVGVWEGHEIETTLNRKGSCEEARWQRLRPLTDRIM